nr:ribonuclease H-like domain-containing protein [Tanacetum cinerariifolium]
MAEVLINSLDAGNLLFMQNNDNSDAPIVNVKLASSDNYKMWSTAIRIAFKRKHKMGFINGSCVILVNSLILSQQWERCNVIVLGWILRSLSTDLYLGKVYFEIAAKMWDELKETYDKIDGSMIFSVIHKIHGLKQGELSVSDYYHKLNSLWREFDTLTLLPTCTYAAHEGVLKHNQLVRLMQFLTGLNDVYQPIRSNLLAKEPLPDVKEAFNIVSREESHRGLHPNSGSSSKAKPTSFVAKSNNLKNNDFKRGSNSTNGGNSPNSLCKNCSLVGHTSERWWMINSGANQHLTNSIKNMFNVIDISSFNLTVGHPNGTLSKITTIGNLRLSANIVLFNVLVVPEYYVSLLSVYKLIKDSKLFVGFDEHKCYIQDLNMIKTVGIGNESGG